MYSVKPRPLSVGQLNTYLKMTVEGDERLKNIFVKGEISNFRPYKSKWGTTFYFTLKDEESEIKAVMWGNSTSKVPFIPEDGMSVLVIGSVKYYDQKGQMQLQVETMEPDGEGALNLAFNQLKERLEKEGLFDPAHKKALPLYPETIGVVTSPSAAAFSDVCNVLSRRWPAANIVLSSASVQGDQAPAQLIKALERLDELGISDVIILTRGGGSIEDLWAFNDENLARAVFNCKTPIITGVGHETDFTIVDFVSDLRAPTPSAAAEKSTPDREEELKRIKDLDTRLKTGVKSKLAIANKLLNSNISRIKAYSPATLLEKNKERLKGNKISLKMNMDKKLSDEKGRFAVLAGKLDSCSPLKVIGRGYSIARNKEGKTIKTVKDIAVGDQLNLLMKDGTVTANVEKIEGTD